MKVDVDLLPWPWKSQALRESTLVFISLEGAETQAEQQANTSGLGGQKRNPIKSQPNTKTSPYRVRFRRPVGFCLGFLMFFPYLLGLPSLPGQLSSPLPPPYVPSTECENKGPVILTPFKGEETARDRAWWFIDVHIDSVGLMANGYSGRNRNRSPPSVEEHSGIHQRPS